MKKQMYVVVVLAPVLALVLGAAQAQTLDTSAAEGLLKKSGCMKCHSVSADKDGPSFKKTAAKYKGKSDAEATLLKHVTTGPMVKVDGREERHDMIKSKDDREIKNAVAYILSR
jgi:cytochrome c